MSFTYKINDEKQMDVVSQRPIKQVDVIRLKRSGNISVQNKGTGILYTRVIISGKPLQGEEEATSSNLSMEVSYRDMDGASIDITSLEQGTDFVAHVTVNNPNQTQYVQDIALTQVFPSGWEIHNTRMDLGPNVHEEDKPDYQDIRDDRVYTYFFLSPRHQYCKNCTRTFTVVLNAAYLGEFYLPGVKVEAMYDNRLSATSKGKWIRVIKPGGV